MHTYVNVLFWHLFPQETGLVILLKNYDAKASKNPLEILLQCRIMVAGILCQLSDRIQAIFCLATWFHLFGASRRQRDVIHIIWLIWKSSLNWRHPWLSALLVGARLTKNALTKHKCLLFALIRYINKFRLQISQTVYLNSENCHWEFILDKIRTWESELLKGSSWVCWPTSSGNLQDSTKRGDYRVAVIKTFTSAWP